MRSSPRHLIVSAFWCFGVSVFGSGCGGTGLIWPTNTTEIFKAAVAAESNVKYTLMTVDFVKPDHPLFGKIVAIPAQPGKNFELEMYDPANKSLILHVVTKRDAVLDRLYAGTMGVQGQQFEEARAQREFAQQQINTLMALVTRILDERLAANNAADAKPDDPKLKDLLKDAAAEAIRQYIADQQTKTGKMSGVTTATPRDAPVTVVAPASSR